MSENEEKKSEANGEKKETIVIAEDSVPNLKILHHLLLKLGYEVCAFENGQLAWDKLQEMTPEDNVVAIISDLMMPVMDGMSLLKNVRESDKYKKIPFVFVSAISDKDQIMQATELGIQGYILKPVTFKRVTEKLKQLFPNKKFSGTAAA